jgi:hypothetical protein
MGSPYVSDPSIGFSDEDVEKMIAERRREAMMKIESMRDR